MRTAAAASLVLAGLVAVGGCKRGEPPVGAPPTARARAMDSATPPKIVMTQEGPVDFGLHYAVTAFRPLDDGGFLVLDSDQRDAFIRRIAPDHSIMWEQTIGSMPGSKALFQWADDVITVGDAAWTVMRFEDDLLVGGQQLRPVGEHGKPDLLLVKLDLTTGKVRSFQQYGNEGLFPGKVSLASDGQSLYAAMLYGDSADGKPGWAPPRSDASMGVRVVRFDNDGNVVWTVDSGATIGMPVEVRASKQQIVVTGTANHALQFGSERIALEATPSEYNPWWAVISLDGSVREAHAAVESSRNARMLAALDDDLVHYVVPRTEYDSACILSIASSRDRREDHKLECPARSIPLVLDRVPEGLFHVRKTADRIEAMLIDMRGETITSASMPAPTTVPRPTPTYVMACRAEARGATCYFVGNDRMLYTVHAVLTAG